MSDALAYEGRLMLRRWTIGAVLALWLALFVTSSGALIWQHKVELGGEGGPYWECTYLGALGSQRRTFFFDPIPEKNTVVPAGVPHCPWLIRLGQSG